MRRSASEVLRGLEMRVAQLENKLARGNEDLELAQLIQKHLEDIGGYEVKDLLRSPRLLILEDIENEYENRHLKSTISDWYEKGLLESEGGVEEKYTPRGEYYEFEWDITTLNRKGVNYVLKLLGL